MRMAKKTTIIYDSWGMIAKELPDEQAGELFKAICAYSFDGEDVEIEDPALRAIFVMIKKKVDDDTTEYMEKVERMKQNRTDNKGQAEVRQKSDRSQTEIRQKSDRDQTEITGESVSVSVSDKDKKRETRSRAFLPPSIDQVRAYCQERKNTVNADQFVDFYSSKGWMVGNNRMKDWKACVRTWEQRSKNNGARSGTPKQRDHGFEQRTDYDPTMLEKLVKN